MVWFYLGQRNYYIYLAGRFPGWAGSHLGDLDPFYFSGETGSKGNMCQRTGWHNRQKSSSQRVPPSGTTHTKRLGDGLKASSPRRFCRLSCLEIVQTVYSLGVAVFSFLRSRQTWDVGETAALRVLGFWLVVTRMRMVSVTATTSSSTSISDFHLVRWLACFRSTDCSLGVGMEQLTIWCTTLQYCGLHFLFQEILRCYFRATERSPNRQSLWVCRRWCSRCYLI